MPGFSTNNLEEITRQAIVELKADGERHGWTRIEAIVGDLPLYPSLREEFHQAVERLDVNAQLADDPIAAVNALAFAANQLPYSLGEEHRARLEANWLDLVRHFAGEFNAQRHTEAENRMAEVIATLMEIALALAVRIGDARATSRAWGNLLLQMLNVFPASAPILAMTRLSVF